MMQLYQCHIIIHLSKYIQTTDGTGRFCPLVAGRESVSSDPVPCFRRQRDLTPEMPSCLLRSTSLLPRGEKIPGKGCQRLRLAKRFQLFQSAIKTSALGKAQHFADNFQSVISNRLIIRDKARPDHIAGCQKSGAFECVSGKSLLDSV